MTQLYGHKWKSQHPLYDKPEHKELGIYSEDFLLWARKTEHLSDAHWKRGMDAVEYRNREAARQGDTDTWPPNYAEFVGMCQPAPGSRMYRPFEPLRLPDKRAQERARQAGAKALDEMKNLFADQGE